MFVRYVWAFRTRVLKTRVPERAFWVNPFFQWYKVNLFPGFEQRNPFPPLKKGCGALVGSKWCMKPPESWSSQLRILFGWGKKVPFPDPFLLWKKKVLTPHKFYRSAINRGLRRLWTFSEKYYVTQRILFAGSKKRIRTLLGSINPLKTPLRSEHAFRNVRFAFCVLVVLSMLELETYRDIHTHTYSLWDASSLFSRPHWGMQFRWEHRSAHHYRQQ